MDLLIKCLTKYISVKYANIIVGYFNCPKRNWAGYTSCSDYIHSKLLNFVTASSLYEFVHFPVRGDNLLDLILSTDNQILSTVFPMPPLGDHVVVHFTLGLNCYEISRYSSDRSVFTYVWKKAAYEGIADYLYNTDWYHLVYCNPSAECAWNAFVAAVWNAIDLYVPKTTSVTNRYRKHYPIDIR